MTLTILAIFVLVFVNRVIDKKMFYKYIITKDINIINSIESIYTDNDNLILEGYAFNLGKDTNDSSVSIFLIGTDNGKEIWPDIDSIYRPDINSYFLSEYDYGKSGFSASLKRNSIQEDECYEIFLNIDYNDSNVGKNIRKTVSSNKFLLNDTLYDYNPYVIEKPNLGIQSELLRNVFSKGYLQFYDKDAGIYIYQYEGNLFWIATNNFSFNSYEQKYIIPYHLYTSQINKLPADRVQYGYDSLGFYFEEHEYVDKSTEQYRVVIKEIPDEYPITYITTGIYDIENKTWLWSGSFHLDNLFNTKE